MKLKQYFQRIPFFWKIYAIIVGLLVFVVSLVEVILEPITARVMHEIYGGFHDWHEVILWAVSLLGPSFAGGYVLSSLLAGKLEKMATASKSLGRGNLHVRLPVENKDDDPFDVMARNFNEMADAIETQMQNERRLLADISHELRSPLARMAIAAELLDRKHGQQECLDLVLRLKKEVEHMSELVSLLLAQAKDKLNLVPGAHRIDLGEFVRNITDDFAFQGEEQGKRIVCSVEGDLFIEGHLPLLQRALGNLLSNALFYSPPGANIDIDARMVGDEVAVSVRDYGPGVPDEQLEDIFRAFYRVDSSRTRSSGGVGLGLTLVKESIVLQGGHVTVKNASPGLCVTLFLPDCRNNS